MDKDVMISVEGLGKKYFLGQVKQPGRYTALRDVLADAVKAPWRRWREGAAGKDVRTVDADFWALRRLNFEVSRGEVVGIVGRNGAGKSTLLKILSRITEPTEGRITIRGRVASLLEVGTGFHPELTGRENIYLNGAILGMHRAEIRAKFDEIVGFAEVERFLDTPVKRYSSGMYVRLAFAVAANLDPEILIVDEVLAVGDVEFQKKCLGKMKNVANQQGRTVLFVSHNLDAVQHLCSRGLLLEEGRLALDTSAEAVVEAYRSRASHQPTSTMPFETDEFVVTQLTFTPDPLEVCGAATFALEVRVTQNTLLSDLCLLVYSANGTRVAIIDFRGDGWPLKLRRGAMVRVSGTVAMFSLVQGEYSIGIYAATAHGHYDCLGLLEVRVTAPADKEARLTYPAEYLGYVHFAHQSQTEIIGAAA